MAYLNDTGLSYLWGKLKPMFAGKLDKSGGTMTGKLTLDGAPTSDLHAATKKYVDDNAGSAPVAQQNWYGESSTAAATQTKAVTIPGLTIATGVIITVKFTNAQSYNGQPKLNVNSTGAVDITLRGSTAGIRYQWLAGEVLQFVYDGTNWVQIDGGLATTTYYGVTKLYSGGTSTSTALALTPASLNNIAQNMISGIPVYSSSATYAVGDRVRYSTYIYECITAISVAEAWTAEHWQALDPLLDMIEEKADASDIPVASTTNPSMDGTASYGSGTSYARSDHVHPTDTTRQDKITASGILKGNGSGGVTAASAGSDYQAPIIVSTSEPTSAHGSDGDIWLVYEA